jgi:hypothetical protein
MGWIGLKYPTYSTGWWCNNHLEKHEFVNGKDYSIYYGKMFKTTNQSSDSSGLRDRTSKGPREPLMRP